MLTSIYFKFKDGALSPEDISNIILGLSEDKSIGAYSSFSGQVRADNINGKEVKAIDYTTYAEMSEKVCMQLMKDVKEKYRLSYVAVWHSLGRVNAGECCLFLLTAAAHRPEAILGCNELIEKIKKELPVWGKEIFTNDTYDWKINI